MINYITSYLQILIQTFANGVKLCSNKLIKNNLNIFNPGSPGSIDIMYDA